MTVDAGDVDADSTAAKRAPRMATVSADADDSCWATAAEECCSWLALRGDSQRTSVRRWTNGTADGGSDVVLSVGRRLMASRMLWMGLMGIEGIADDVGMWCRIRADSCVGVVGCGDGVADWSGQSGWETAAVGDSGAGAVGEILRVCCYRMH